MATLGLSSQANSAQSGMFSPSSLSPGKLVSSLQLNCLDSMVPIRHNTSFYVAQDLSSSYGLCLTRVICESSDIRHPVIELHQPKEVASAVASMLIKSLHEREWASGLNATTTSQPRISFSAACSDCEIPWPPSLDIIPTHRAVWTAMVRYISATKRLRKT
ncbi:uncharacterized protein LOC123471261 [Daphnia magna]|uniref:uncharacterized protein LOC123471261 n=1 Tax=Daphnia magna TaxID=35525 RepID=UPI001E1BD8D8|nr:uncharacterized protein LOC123471261 [Daphnia magna]